MSGFVHESVLAREVVEALRPEPGKLLLDGTLGGGGHALLLLERGARVIGIDNAVEWICSGSDKKPDAALKDGAVDAVVAPEALRDAAIAMVKQAVAGVGR